MSQLDPSFLLSAGVAQAVQHVLAVLGQYLWDSASSQLTVSDCIVTERSLCSLL